jgi:hypothetical protein
VVEVGQALKLTPVEVDEVWVRWRSGQAVKVLSRQMRVSPSTVRDPLHRTGGIRPTPKRRWELRLSLAEREEISRGLAAGSSLRMIATGLGRAPSTVSREVLGNGGRSRYRAAVADRVATQGDSSGTKKVGFRVVLGSAPDATVVGSRGQDGLLLRDSGRSTVTRRSG